LGISVYTAHRPAGGGPVLRGKVVKHLGALVHTGCRTHHKAETR
jgi:hypothetical protein